jgi:4-amino-4-deoxy-L-arabinose transferase-like glycosyltransferase
LSRRNFFILLFLALVVFILNLRLDVMLIDAAQYAEMSWEMFTTHNYLRPHCQHLDYLDKPPLIFWLGTMSYAIFGIHNFAYKLPSLIFALLAIFSTYRLAKMYYNENLARVAAVMLASTQALFLITNDVRTDTLLMGVVIFAIWQGATWIESGKTRHLILTTIGIGLAMLAKGPIGLVATGAALLPHAILKAKWRRLFDKRLFFAAIILIVVLFPMCLGLYQQFGLKGLRFYFWTQSFGRITGESEWNNHPDTFFLLHSTAWAFLPWTLFLLIGWINGLINLTRKRLNDSAGQEFISINGFTLVLFMLMLSKYQLPHYAFIVYPLGAVLAAKGWEQVTNYKKTRPFIVALQLLLIVGVMAISILLQYALIGFDALSIAFLMLLFIVAIIAAIASHLEILQKLFFASALTFIAFNFMLSAFYFPAILKYQPQGDFGRYIKAAKNPEGFACYKIPGDFALDFYAQQFPLRQYWDKSEFVKALHYKKELLVYAPSDVMQELQDQQIPFKIIEEREMYPVALLSLPFLNPATRSSVCKKVCLLEVKSP